MQPSILNAAPQRTPYITTSTADHKIHHHAFPFSLSPARSIAARHRRTHVVFGQFALAIGLRFKTFELSCTTVVPVAQVGIFLVGCSSILDSVGDI